MSADKPVRQAINFVPVRTKADLETLDHDDIVAGYMEAKRGDPEPGPNRGRAYWHGWRNRMISAKFRWTTHRGSSHTSFGRAECTRHDPPRAGAFPRRG